MNVFKASLFDLNFDINFDVNFDVNRNLDALCQPYFNSPVKSSYAHR